MRYRPDIDGLRGLAVAAVVLFHLGVPGFGGGYAGVDVFFVISGYLITSLILPDIEAGRFSLISFYERRVRRLFPALLVVLAFACVAGARILPRHELQDLYESVAATALFAANFLFWKTTGYFDGAAETRPLLHLWSIAVEEQFYIVFPALLLLGVRHLQRHVFRLAAAIALASLAASALLTWRYPEAAYYLPWFRAWELLLGVLLAVRPAHPASPALREAMGAGGLALIGWSVVAFSRDTVFPGYHAVVPCAGAALVIVSGSGASSATRRVLEWRPLVFTGLISYSLYLWHWPLLVYARHLAIRDLTTVETAGVLALSVAVASASWRCVERPFRGRRGALSRPVLLGAAAAASVTLVAAGIAGYHGNAPKAAHGAQAEAGPRFLPYRHCMNREAAGILAGNVCTLGATGPARPSFLLWGDSHAGAIAPAVHLAAERAGRSGLFLGQAGCPPLLGVERRDRGDLPCREFNETVARLLERNPEVRTVLLAARWAMYAEGTRPEDRGAPTVRIAPGGPGGNAQALGEGLEATAAWLAKHARDLVFVAQVPEIPWDVPAALERSQAEGREPPDPPSRRAYLARQGKVTRAVQDVSRRHPLRVIDPASLLCKEGICRVAREGQPLYLDSNHLGSHGNRYVADAFRDVLAAPPREPAPPSR